MVQRSLGKICTTVAADTCDTVAAKAKTAISLGTDIVEFRLDKLTEAALGTVVRQLQPFARRAIVTVRSKEEGGGFRGEEEERLELISSIATKMKPAYLDVELRTVEANPKWFQALSGVSSRSWKTIVSWHDFGGTPDLKVLRTKRAGAAKWGEVAKIVTMARTPQDNLTLLTLYRDDPRGLIAFCMGSDGTASRVLSLKLGSPVVYASLPGEPVAPGQLSVVTVKALKEMMMMTARAEGGGS